MVIQDIRGTIASYAIVFAMNARKKGHIASVCSSSKNVLIVTDSPYEELFRIPSTTKDGICVTMNIERKDVSMQVDTGCGVSIVPYSVYKKFSDNVTLEICNTRRHTYTGENIKPHGKCIVNVKDNRKQLQLPLIIVNINQNIPLLGRNWLHLVQLNWPALRKSYNVNYVNTTSHENLFDDSLGCYMVDPINLTVDSDPTFHRDRKIPYSILSKVEEALNKMESGDIIRKVKTASCAAPIVPIEKNSGDIRICGDFRVTYNKCSSPAVPCFYAGRHEQYGFLHRNESNGTRDASKGSRRKITLRSINCSRHLPDVHGETKQPG